jgi:hypothetical protein
MLVFVLMGFALLGANAWYASAVYKAVTGRGEIIIAPIVVTEKGGQDKGVALAHMLQARLREIETDLQRAQKELMSPDPAPAGQPPPGAAPASSGAGGVTPALARSAMPRLLTQPVALRSRLLESTQLDVSVGGVPVGGIVNWLQRQMETSQILTLTLYEGKGSAQISGSLSPLGLKDDAVRVPLQVADGAESISMNELIEATAYEIMRRRMAEDSSNRAEALDRSEFQTLVEVLRDTAWLNRRVALGRGAIPEFVELLEKVTPLADEVPDWYQLNYLAASIAESAHDPESARNFYLRVEGAAAKAKENALLDHVKGKLSKLNESLTASDETETPTGPGSELARSAKDKIKGYISTATEYLNVLLGHELPVPPVQVKTKLDAEGWISYWDGKKVVVPRTAEALPDIVYREASWPHVINVVGSEAFDRKDETATILHSYVDILPMLIQQDQLKQDAKTSQWELGVGYEEIADGQPAAQVKKGTPYLSFKLLGTTRARSGGWSQVGHMRDFDSVRPREERVYINCGIFNRAFYESAQRIGSLESAKIWVAALRRLKNEKRVDFPRFAQILYEAASQSERNQVRAALSAVGLDPKPVS